MDRLQRGAATDGATWLAEPRGSIPVGRIQWDNPPGGRAHFRPILVDLLHQPRRRDNHVFVRGERLRGAVPLPVWEDVAKRNAQSAAESIELQDRGIPYAALDTGHVGPVDTRRVGKMLLGPAPLRPHLSDAVSNSSKQRVPGVCHAPMFRS